MPTQTLDEIFSSESKSARPPLSDIFKTNPKSSFGGAMLGASPLANIAATVASRFNPSIAKRQLGNIESARTELMGPVTGAASLYAGDIPKAFGRIDKSKENKQAFETMYPEQQTAPGKTIRFGLSVPALIMGSGARLATGAGKILTKAGAKFLRSAPNIAGSAVSKAAGGAAKIAAEGAAFGAGYAPEKPEDYADQVAGSALTNVAGAGLIKGISKIPSLSKVGAARMINSLIKPFKGQFAYGKNPGLAVAKKGIKANSMEDLLTKVGQEANTTGGKILQTIQAHEATSPIKKSLNIISALKPIEKAMDKAASQNNQALLNRLNDVKKSIVYNLRKGNNNPNKIKVEGVNNLSKMSPTGAFELKKKIADMTKWTGNISDDAIVNAALQDSYRRVKVALNLRIPQLRLLNEEYGGLVSAREALKNAVVREQKKDFIPLSGKIIGGGGIIAGLASGNYELIAEGIAAAGVTKLLSTPFARTRMASGLAKLSEIDKAKLARKFPELAKGISVAGRYHKPVLSEQDIEAIKKVKIPAGLSIEDVSGSSFGTQKPSFEGFSDITTKTLEKLKGRSSVSKQFISDLTNQPELKQAERDTIRQVLDEYKGEVPVKEFADKVKTQLLPLKANKSYAKYENISLSPEERGPIESYAERVYESPIKTSVGDTHFGIGREYFEDEWEDIGGYAAYAKEAKNRGFKGYFAHSRIEDLPSGSRRVIELQSDLFQKGNLEREAAGGIKTPGGWDYKSQKQRDEIEKLRPYENTWHERIIREEIKQAAIDGKTKLQFPTGETAMKIEGLEKEFNPWIYFDESEYAVPLTINDLKVGRRLARGEGFGENATFDEEWIITDILGDGKFKAVGASSVPKVELIEGNGKWRLTKPGGVVEIYREKPDAIKIANKSNFAETFDIMQGVDKKSPIYRFYEKEVAKYLKRIAPDMKYVTDKRGVSWFEIGVPKEKAKLPIEAFGAGGAALAGTQQNKDKKLLKVNPIMKKRIAKAENYGKTDGDWAQLENVVLDDLKQIGKLAEDVTLEQVKKDPALYDHVAQLYIKRLDDFGIPEKDKALWWLMPGRYKKAGGDISKLDSKFRNIMENRVKNMAQVQ